MKSILYKLMELQLQHVDPRVYELEKDIEFYQVILAILGLVLVLLLLIIYLQRVAMTKLKRGEEPKGLFKKKKSLKQAVAASSPKASVNLKDLPDPGVIFKYSLGKEQVMEMVRVLLALKEAPRPDHAADALGVAICHAHSRGVEERVARELAVAERKVKG